MGRVWHGMACGKGGREAEGSWLGGSCGPSWGTPKLDSPLFIPQAFPDACLLPGLAGSRQHVKLLAQGGGGELPEVCRPGMRGVNEILMSSGLGSFFLG